MGSFFIYKGKNYGVGTRVRMKTKYCGVVESTFNGGNIGRWSGQNEYSYDCLKSPDYYIVEIIEPVYYYDLDTVKRKGNIFTRTGSGGWDAYNEVCTGLLWYIFVMIIGTFFNARLKIWTMATIAYFSWKQNK